MISPPIRCSEARRGSAWIREIDDYLWEVYLRQPAKRDRGGDFSWKDPAAAKRMGKTLQAYVVIGMDADFRELVYHAELVGFSKLRDYKMPPSLRLLMALTKIPVLGKLLSRPGSA